MGKDFPKLCFKGVCDAPFCDPIMHECHEVQDSSTVTTKVLGFDPKSAATKESRFGPYLRNDQCTSTPRSYRMRLGPNSILPPWVTDLYEVMGSSHPKLYYSRLRIMLNEYSTVVMYFGGASQVFTRRVTCSVTKRGTFSVLAFKVYGHNHYVNKNLSSTDSSFTSVMQYLVLSASTAQLPSNECVPVLVCLRMSTENIGMIREYLLGFMEKLASKFVLDRQYWTRCKFSKNFKTSGYI